MFQICRSIRGFEWLIFVSVGCSPILFDHPLAAAECRNGSADYSAHRTTIIGKTTFVSKVYISGNKMREEETGPNGRPTVVIRLSEQGINYVFDPERKEGVQMQLPPPPAAPMPHSRQIVDKRPDGLAINHIQLLADGEWKDVSTTICRPDGVMLEQEFTIVDPHGNPLKGRLTQTDINVGALSQSLFLVPEAVVIKRP